MTVNFGPYELDTGRGSLKKYGVPMRLREQAIQVLVALVENPGELVTREELRRRLWNHGTIVDFDVGLNTAVSRLRQVLNDPVSSSRLIETVPKRGYRFIAPIPKRHALAVMPFVNHGADPDAEYIGEELTDELIRACWRVEGLRVAGRANVSRVQKETCEPVRAARELGVDFLLHGSVQKSADRLRIRAHLVNGADGFEMWAERFDIDSKDLCAIEEQVAERIAAILQSRLKALASGVRPSNSEAYSAYLKGHFLIKRHSPLNSAKAMQYFEEAMRADPGYPLAYHGAAIVLMLNTMLGLLPSSEGMAKAETLVQRGLAIHPDGAMLQMTLGMLRMFQRRWPESEQAYRRAIALEPCNPHPHMMFALHQSYLGRHDTARDEAQAALEIDPVDSMINFRMVQVAFYARQYEEAIRLANTTIELAPDFHSPYGYLALAQMSTGNRKEAWQTAQKAKLLGRGLPFSEGQFGHLAGVLGYTAEARNVITELTALRDRGYGPALPIAWTWLGLDDRERGLEWMRTAVEEREPFLAAAAVSPLYDQLRPDSRFPGLLSSMGFDENRIGDYSAGGNNRAGSGHLINGVGWTTGRSAHDT